MSAQTYKFVSVCVYHYHRALYFHTSEALLTMMRVVSNLQHLLSGHVNTTCSLIDRRGHPGSFGQRAESQ